MFQISYDKNINKMKSKSKFDCLNIEKEKGNQYPFPVKNKSNFELIGTNTLLFNGNCIDKMQLIKSESTDLILTDPPYNLGNFMHSRNTNLIKMRENQFAYAEWDKLSQEDWTKEIEKFFKESSRVLKKGGTLLIFMSLMKIETIVNIAQKHNFYYKTTGIWHKTNPMPRNMHIHFVNSTEAWVYFIKNNTSGTFNNKGKLVHDFIETSATTSKEKKFGKHPTQKPIKLISHFIKHLSNENDLVLDPFMGSGTTGVCSSQLNRNFIGIELDKTYYDLSIKRLNHEKT
ncbi:MAG: DNA-methyltransferase [Bacillota bacterium]